VTYLETWGSTQPYVAFSHLNFVLVFLFLPALTWHQILIYGISRCLLCLMSNLFSWFLDGACFSCLVVTTPSGEGSLLVWGGFVCRNPLRLPANLWTTGTVGQKFVLLVQCLKFLSVKSFVSLSVSLSLRAECLILLMNVHHSSILISFL